MKLAAKLSSLSMDLSSTNYYVLLAKGDGEMSYHTQVINNWFENKAGWILSKPPKVKNRSKLWTGPVNENN